MACGQYFTGELYVSPMQIGEEYTTGNKLTNNYLRITNAVQKPTCRGCLHGMTILS